MKTYKITFPDLTWECTVEIDPDFIRHINSPDGLETLTVADTIKIMVEFWWDWESRLFYNNGDYTITFLQQLANEILTTIISNNYNLDGVIYDFNNKEGWCPMDGSHGIKIINADEVDFRDRDFQVSEVL